jgi:hypothetical protein
LFNHRQLLSAADDGLVLISIFFLQEDSQKSFLMLHLIPPPTKISPFFLPLVYLLITFFLAFASSNVHAQAH